MFPHHEESIKVIKAHFEQDGTIEALLLGGSIAHGFEKADSDVDLLIVVTEEAYQERLCTNETTLVDRTLCTYPGGYVDAKYISRSFIRLVAEKGSEAARFAFEAAKIIFSRVDGIQEEIDAAARYPVEGKQDRIRRFRVQLEAWNWFCSEGKNKENRYLLNMAASKLILFGGRLILAHNERLYPYHKWFLRVLEEAPDKPEGLMAMIDALAKEPTEENVTGFYETVKSFGDWGEMHPRWGRQFLLDSELNWLHLQTPIDDL